MSDNQRETMEVDPVDYIYPFENLVFEGGGMKAIAYCGAIQVLDYCGILPQIKRFAGTSAGASAAAMLALGYQPSDLVKLLSQDLSVHFKDARFGILSLLPNLITSYGWHPANGVYKWFGEAIAKKFNGNADLTFSELYSQTGKELCIVVTNVNYMTEEYCHVKTTPTMPIRVAVRMSMGVPGALTAVPYSINGETNSYVDGGVLCNMPIHCYDGWWLSMEPGDSFLEKLQPLDKIPRLLTRENRFAFSPDMNKTLGLSLYSEVDRSNFRFLIEDRFGYHMGDLPDTTLTRERQQHKEIQEQYSSKYKEITAAVNSFLKVLKKHNLNKDDKIDREELQHAFDDPEFTTEHAYLLFGKDSISQTAFETLDTDKSGEVEYHEVMAFIQSNGISLQKAYFGHQRTDFEGVLSFFGTLGEAVHTNLNSTFVEGHNIDRIVGINTGYIDSNDFAQEPADRAFVMKQGRVAMENYLKHYIKSNNLPKRTVEKNRTKKILPQIQTEKVDIQLKTNKYPLLVSKIMCVFALFTSIILLKIWY